MMGETPVSCTCANAAQGIMRSKHRQRRGALYSEQTVLAHCLAGSNGACRAPSRHIIADPNAVSNHATDSSPNLDDPRPNQPATNNSKMAPGQKLYPRATVKRIIKAESDCNVSKDADVTVRLRRVASSMTRG